MTSKSTLRAAEEQFGALVLEKTAELEEFLRDLPSARSLESLVDEAAPLRFGQGHVVVDLGAGRGMWSTRLTNRYRCACVAVDISHVSLRTALSDGIPSVVADVDVMPFADGSVDGVWCRDMLEMVDDPVATLRECFRVLRRGAGMLLYVPFMTERMSSFERAELLTTLNSSDWWGRGREPIEEAIQQAGFEVLLFSITSPEYSENILLNDPTKITEQLAEHAQLRRGGEALASAVGKEWHERFLAWSRWQAYLLLGKLENGLWLLRKPD